MALFCIEMVVGLVLLVFGLIVDCFDSSLSRLWASFDCSLSDCGVILIGHWAGCVLVLIVFLQLLVE